MNQTIQIQL